VNKNSNPWKTKSRPFGRLLVLWRGLVAVFQIVADIAECFQVPLFVCSASNMVFNMVKF